MCDLCTWSGIAVDETCGVCGRADGGLIVYLDGSGCVVCLDDDDDEDEYAPA